MFFKTKILPIRVDIRIVVLNWMLVGWVIFEVDFAVQGHLAMPEELLVVAAKRRDATDV